MKIAPMLAQIGNPTFLTRDNFIFEPKLDGTRAIAYIDTDMQFINKRDNNITHRYPEFQWRKAIDAKTCILDGEIIVYNELGNPDFRLLQSREHLTRTLDIQYKSKSFPATYVVFDILMKNGKSLLDKPQMERKKILEETVEEAPHLQIMIHSEDGQGLWEVVKKRKLEGIIAKEKDGLYFPGKRTRMWYKVKFLKTIDALIIGYLSKKRNISSFALGLYDENKQMRYIGRVGTGFTDKFLAELLPELQKRQVKTPVAEYKGKEDIKWVKPELVCEVEFLEMNPSRILRAPAFKRLREDKPPEQCTFEQ